MTVTDVTVTDITHTFSVGFVQNFFYVIVYELLPSPKDVNNDIYIAKAPKQYFGWVIGCGDVLKGNPPRSNTEIKRGYCFLFNKLD